MGGSTGLVGQPPHVNGHQRHSAGQENAQIVAIDPTAPYLIVGARSGAHSIKVVNLATGHVGAAIHLPASLSPFFSVQFP